MSTFSFGPFADDEADGEAEVALEDELGLELDLSMVPVISTLCPTCALSFDSSASRRYVDPAIEDEGVDAAPDVPVVLVALPVELLLDAPAELAFVRMNAASVVLAAGVVLPVVPVAPAVPLEEARATHPVTVT